MEMTMMGVVKVKVRVEVEVIGAVVTGNSKLDYRGNNGLKKAMNELARRIWVCEE